MKKKHHAGPSLCGDCGSKLLNVRAYAQPSDEGIERREWWCACGFTRDATDVPIADHMVSRLVRWERMQLPPRRKTRSR